MTAEEFDEEEYDGPSKSQVKREFKAITDMGAKLVTFSDAQLTHLPYPEILDAIEIYRKKIKKGNAKKRQLQFIGKLLRNVDLDHVQQIIDRFDASSRTYNTHFHLIETWRDRIIAQDKQVLAEILDQLPDIDKQRLGQFSRNAIKEQSKRVEQTNNSSPPVHFRKLFKFLKESAESLLSDQESQYK